MRRRHERDIPVLLSHPVPVPTLPARGLTPGLGFVDAATPASIPFVPPDAFGTFVQPYPEHGKPGGVRFATHAGRLWQPLPLVSVSFMWGPNARCWDRDLPLPRFRSACEAQAAGRFDAEPAHMRLAGYSHLHGHPLCLRRTGEPSDPYPGPRDRHRPLSDLSAPCREAVDAFARTRLAHDGECLFVAVPRLFLEPWSSAAVSHPWEPPDPWDPAFPHEAAQACREWALGPGPDGGRPRGLERLGEAALSLSRVQNGSPPSDVAEQFANHAACLVVDAVRGVLRRGGEPAAEARRRLADGLPTLALAMVSALRGDAVRPALERVRDLAAFGAENHPARERRADLARVVPAVDATLQHALRPPPVDDEDAEMLGRLAP